MIWKRVKFPERTAGGDWWVCRWRLNFLLGWNESESIAWCRKYIRPGMVVLDIGAHLGYYTRIFSDLVAKSGVVLAFEPCPENIPVLTYNLSGARYRNVKIIEKAVSAGNGRDVLFVAAGHSMHSLNAGYTPEQGRVEVDTVALDEFIPVYQIDRVGFIKIDVEGAEPLVLDGMRRMAGNLPGLTMLVECNPVALRAGGSDPEKLLADLSDMGFVPRRIFPDGSLGALDPASDECVNLLCVRRG
jgi:FkbM family methyltransferase